MKKIFSNRLCLLISYCSKMCYNLFDLTVIRPLLLLFKNHTQPLFFKVFFILANLSLWGFKILHKCSSQKNLCFQKTIPIQKINTFTSSPISPITPHTGFLSTFAKWHFSVFVINWFFLPFILPNSCESLVSCQNSLVSVESFAGF